MTIQRPLVSIIITAYVRTAMLREAVSCFRAQTYSNIEMIMVNNGGNPETISYLLELEKEEQRVKLIHFETNQFSLDDHGLEVRVAYNAGLRAATGELVFHQGDDDWVATDYVERMVRLFEENAECTTAIGRCVNALPDGTFGINPPAKRSRYMPGHELALDDLTGSKKTCQFNSGYCFVMKRDELELNGGFNGAYEAAQMFAIVPFGVTGYDPDAIIYWRKHEDQLNKLLTAQGRLCSEELFSMIDDLDLENKWKIFGNDTARYVVKTIKDNQAAMAARVFGTNLFALRLKACLRTVGSIWFIPKFWMCLPKSLSQTHGFRLKLYNKIRPLLRPLINSIDRNYPELRSRSAFFNKLIQHL
jgi:glycosyltransferase involved in cell wall biosynthesis